MYDYITYEELLSYRSSVILSKTVSKETHSFEVWCQQSLGNSSLISVEFTYTCVVLLQVGAVEPFLKHLARVLKPTYDDLVK